jgi:hypothetical protein
LQSHPAAVIDPLSQELGNLFIFMLGQRHRGIDYSRRVLKKSIAVAMSAKGFYI